jgi:urease accessory protein
MSTSTDGVAPVPVSEFHERALLQAWFTLSFPIGSFAYSQGLEKAVEHGLVWDADTLSAWIADVFKLGAISNDLIFAACAWKATTMGNTIALRSVAELAAALQPSGERYLEAVTLGSSFLEIIRQAWPNPDVTWILEQLGDRPAIPYPVAAGLVSGAYRLSLVPTLESYALSFASAQISAGIRLGVTGQTAGQRIIASLLPALSHSAALASQAALEDAGTACFSADLCCLEHETQYTRLFRS